MITSQKFCSFLSQTFCSFAANFCSVYAGSNTFPTNESDWSRKVNKVKKILVKPGGRKPRNSLTATAAKYKKNEQLEIYRGKPNIYNCEK